MMCHRERSEAISYSIAGAGDYEQAGPKKVTLRPYNLHAEACLIGRRGL